VIVESFDYEDQIVSKMQESVPAELKDRLSFKVGDCTDLKALYGEGRFNVAVDKGTLDAIAVDVREETI